MHTALEFALQELQLKAEESPKGSNWGPFVQKYLLSVGLKAPAPWCMAFVYWCVEQARLANNLEKNPLAKTGGVLSQWEKSKKLWGVNIPVQGSLVAEKGDIIILNYGKGLGHTGIIESVEGKILHTVEGNTTDDLRDPKNIGTREGYEVCRMTRKLEKVHGLIRLGF